MQSQGKLILVKEREQSKGLGILIMARVDMKFVDRYQGKLIAKERIKHGFGILSMARVDMELVDSKNKSALCKLPAQAITNGIAFSIPTSRHQASSSSSFSAHDYKESIVMQPSYSSVWQFKYVFHTMPP